MGHKLDPHPLERRIADLAARQHGVVSRAQLVELGLSGSAIAKRARAGRLHRLHRGVYAVGHVALTQHGRFMAAVLACGDGAVLSHGSAAALWGLPWRRTARIDVTVPRGGGRSARRLIVVHRAALAPGEVATRDGIPVTSPSRTLVDLADHGGRRSLERAIDEAAYLRLGLEDVRPRQGKRGHGLLTSVLAEHEAGGTRTRSELEERMLRLCRGQGLPVPEVNSTVEGYEVDFAWRGQRVVVETDGFAAHGTRAAFERDRLKDGALVEAGWRVLRVTYRQLGAQPEAVGGRIQRVLASGSRH